jgi:hypothetical protein
MLTLVAEVQTNRKGIPNPLRLAVIARSHFDTVRLPFPPASLQRGALAIGAPLGQLLSHRAKVAGARRLGRGGRNKRESRPAYQNSPARPQPAPRSSRALKARAARPQGRCDGTDIDRD